jgi:hypothetical protein
VLVIGKFCDLVASERPLTAGGLGSKGGSRADPPRDGLHAGHLRHWAGRICARIAAISSDGRILCRAQPGGFGSARICSNHYRSNRMEQPLDGDHVKTGLTVALFDNGVRS